MPGPNFINEDDVLHDLYRCCDDTSTSLEDLRAKLLRFIEIQKQSSGGGAGSSLMFHQAQSALNKLDNFQAISASLAAQIPMVKNLKQQVRQALGEEVGAGLSLGGSGSREEGEDGGGDSGANK